MTNSNQQPTSFDLTTYPLSATIEDASLLSSLSLFSSYRLATLDSRLQANTIPRRASVLGDGTPDAGPTADSVLFLHIQTAADYFSHEQSLMENVPPVTVDLILDPFLLNVFPRSLVPTAGWIGVVTVVAIFVARWVSGEIGRVIEEGRTKEENEDKKAK